MALRILYVLLAVLLIPVSSYADDRLQKKIELGKTYAEFGVTTAALLWRTDNGYAAHAQYPNSSIIKLATDVQRDLDNAKASSNFGRALGDAASATFFYAATLDVEPVSKTSLYVAAYATKSATDYIADSTYKKVQEQALGMVRKALDDRQNNLTPDILANMPKDELLNRLPGLMIENRSLRDIFAGNEEAQKLLRANVEDFIMNTSVAALATVKGIDKNVDDLRDDVVSMNNDLKTFKNETEKRLGNITNLTKDIKKASEDSNAALKDLLKATDGNSRAIKELSEISYMGWSTEQKLAAMENGQFPGIKGDARINMIKSLQADKRREETVATLQLVSRDLSSLTTIASNLGVPSNVVNAFNTANTVTNAIIKFESGDMLGAIATASSLFGGGKSDPAAERHKQMMDYLYGEFKQIHEQLKKIEELQMETLKSIAALNNFMLDFRNEIHQKLTGIEDRVYLNASMLNYLIRQSWSPCNVILNEYRGSKGFSDRDKLFKLLDEKEQNAYFFQEAWKSCRTAVFNFVHGEFASNLWSGSLADLRVGADAPSSVIREQQAVRDYVTLRAKEFDAAKKVLEDGVPDLIDSPAPFLIQLSQPAPSVAARDARDGALKAKLDLIKGFKCDSKEDILYHGLRKLACGVYDGNSTPPASSEVNKVFGNDLIGPQGWSMVDSMIAVSRFAAFTRVEKGDVKALLKSNDLSRIVFLTKADISSAVPSDALKATVAQHNGVELLYDIMPLAEMNILQQSIAYGDLVPQMVFDILYDPATKALKSQVDPKASQAIQIKQGAALDAMKVNPILARNTVMLAVRKALIDESGNFPITYYRFAINEFKDFYSNYNGQLPCANNPDIKKIYALFPHWNIEYMREKSKQESSGGKKAESTSICKEEEDNTKGGVGLVLNFGDFSVSMPSVEIASEGVFEYPKSLAMALSYRTKIRQEVIDREVYKYFTDDGMKAEFLDSASMLNSQN